MEAASNASVMHSSLLTEKIEDVLAYLPENPVQHKFAYWWIWATTNLSETFIFTYLPVMMHEVLFFSIIAPTFLFQFIPFMRRYKIQSAVERPIDQWDALKMIAFNHFITQVPMIIIPPSFQHFYGIPYDWESMPRWYVIMAAVYFCAMVEDAWHYFFHRLAHHKMFYKRFHKVHHAFHAPFGLTSEYSHPVEVVVLGFGFFPGLFVVCNHMSIMFSWMILRIWFNIDLHCGYDFPLNPLKLIPFYGGVRYHDFHHSHNNANFSSTFTWWDWLLGTDEPYKDYLQKKTAAQDKED